jgi:eukaryotic-like serine/threonine-protein kinase
VRVCVRCSNPIAASRAFICSVCGAPQPMVASYGHTGRLALTPGLSIPRPDARFVLDRILGEGAMGIVWLAWRFFDPRSPKGFEPPERIAIKFMRERGFGTGTSDQHRTSFRNEADAMRRLDHPNVVRFIELFEFEDTLALAMEYVDGDTFEQILARHVARAKHAGAGALPGIPFQRAFYYFEQVLGALAASHALGIVHRDVKPSNVIVRRDGITKLTDFGIAHLARKTRYVSPQPSENELVAGTGPYMSPEQVMGLPLDGRSDLYSAAIVLFELLTARTPFEVEGKTEWMIRLSHAEERPLPLRRALAQAPAALETLIARALEKDQARRFASTLDFGSAIRSALGMGESSGWRAQEDFARGAPRFRGQTVKLAPGERSADTLRDIIVKKYRTMPLTAPHTTT